MDSRAHNFFNGWEQFGDLSTFWCVHCGWGDKNVDWVLDPIRKARNDRLSWGVSRGYSRANFGNTIDAGCLTEGFGACRFIDNWLEAIDRDCAAVYVQSWNDMGEDHHILESNFLGDSFIRLDRHLADWFRAGHEPAVGEEKLLMFHRRHLVDAEMETHPGRDPQHPSWTSAPLCDYVHVVSLLKRPGDLELTLGDETLRLANVGAGLRDWLVVVPRTKDHGGNQPYWNEGSYEKTMPFDTDRRRVTTVRAIPACTPVARLSRDGRPDLEVVSRTGIADRFRFHCFAVIGSVSK
ncbi:MAG: endo-1,3-alpha-glucanase family glycosylhydrolase [Kiritimatiellia bacterium]